MTNHEWNVFYDAVLTVHAPTREAAAATSYNENDMLQSIEPTGTVYHSSSCECGGIDDPVENDEE